MALQFLSDKFGKGEIKSQQWKSRLVQLISLPDMRTFFALLLSCLHFRDHFHVFVVEMGVGTVVTVRVAAMIVMVVQEKCNSFFLNSSETEYYRLILFERKHHQINLHF